MITRLCLNGSAPQYLGAQCSLRSSLCDCIKAASAFCCQSSAGSAVLSTEFLGPMDVRLSLLPADDVYRDICVILFTQSLSLHVYSELKTISFQSTGVYSALGAVYRR